MGKNDYKKIYKKIKGIFIMAVIAFAFIYLIEVNVRMESVKNVNEVNKQVANTFNRELQFSEDKLDFSRDYINDLKSLYGENYDEDLAIESINSKNNNTLFEHIAIGDSEGNLNFGDEIINVADRNYYKNALNGELTVSKVLLSRYNNEKVVAFAKPLNEKEVGKGVVVGFIDYNELRESIVNVVYGDAGKVFIVDEEGNVQLEEEEKNIFNVYENDDNLAIVKENMKNEVDGGVDKISFNGTESFLAYYKIDLAQGWYLASRIPINTVFSNLENITKITFFAIISFLTIAIFSEIIRYKKSKIIIENASIIDKTTNLKNYIGFKRGCKALAYKNKNYVMFSLDIIGFRYINDKYDYTVGDSILLAIAQKLKLMEALEIGRLGNDLFTLMFQVNNDEISNLVEKMKVYLNELNEEGNIDLKFKLGICSFKSEDVIEKIVHNANLAKLEVGSNEIVNYYIYDEKLDEKIEEHNFIDLNLKNCLEKGEFKVVYQPKVNLKNEKIVGAEALLRWISKERGFISPAVFIPIAELNGDINIIGRWVFDRVCNDLVRSIKRGENIVPTSVNLSRIELEQKDLVQFLEHTIRKYDIPPEYLEIEITETSALNDVRFINTKINEIKKIGIKVSMDDFGTGNSTLANLKNINIDILKIDRSILLDIDIDEKSKSLIKSIIEIAKKYGFKVVCEGVENKSQVEILKGFGCDIIQGFVYFKPMDLKELKEVLNEQKK